VNKLQTEPHQFRFSRDVRVWDVETDVLVIGLGCAGAAAAIQASAEGVDVFVAERCGGGGGTSAMSGGVIYLGGGTDLQTQCGFEDSPEDMFKYLSASCGRASDHDKLSVYCEDSVEHYQWLCRCGVPFKPVFYPHYSGEPPTDDGLVFSGSEQAHPYCEVARPAPRGHVPQTKGQAGVLLMHHLVAEAERSSATISTDTLCQTLIVDDSMSVVGAVLSRDGQELLVRARGGVILAAGGFILNKEMVQLHAPALGDCAFLVGSEGDDGRGIRMGMGVGGCTVNMAMGSISLPIIPPKSMQKGILVNSRGQRFVNEDAYYGVFGEYALNRCEGAAYLILDTKLWEKPEVERAVAATGENAQELERSLNLPTGSLRHTLDLYNEHASNGCDPVFHKDGQWVEPLEAPYGALDCRVESSLYAAFTLGGLRTTVDGQVLGADANVINGLFAAGRSSACLAAPGYSSGLSLGDGTFFGRRAARKAAANC